VPTGIHRLFRRFAELLDVVMDSVKAYDEHSLEENVRDWLQQYEKLFGTAACSVNLHLFSHIAEQRRALVRLSDVWLFGFERQNFFLKSVSSHVKQTPEFRMLQALKISSLIRHQEQWRITHPSEVVDRSSSTSRGPRGSATACLLTDSLFHDCRRLLEANFRESFELLRSCKSYRSYCFPKIGEIPGKRKHVPESQVECRRCSHVVSVLLEDHLEYCEVQEYFSVDVHASGGEVQTIDLVYVNWLPVSRGPTAQVRSIHRYRWHEFSG